MPSGAARNNDFAASLAAVFHKLCSILDHYSSGYQKWQTAIVEKATAVCPVYLVHKNSLVAVFAYQHVAILAEAVRQVLLRLCDALGICAVALVLYRADQQRICF